MSLDSWPTDKRAALALVALAVAEILEANDADREVMLADFLGTAWPSERGMRQ